MSRFSQALSMPDYAELQEALFVAKEKQLNAHDVAHDTQVAKFFRLRLATSSLQGIGLVDLSSR